MQAGSEPDMMPRQNIRVRRAMLLLYIALLSTIVGYGQYRSATTAKAGTTANSPDAAEVALGRRLFFDPRLSADGRVSCASCHDPAHGFSDVRALSPGVFGRHAQRHTPTLLGRSFGTSQFWDGRAATLEEQVLQPIANPDEMGMTVEGLLERLNQDRAYRSSAGTLTRESLAAALADYVRTLQSYDSPIDRFLSGRTALGAYSDPKNDDGNGDRDRELLRDGLKDPGSNYYTGKTSRSKQAPPDAGFTALELEGYRLFQDKARCYLCHSGRQYTDEGFHNTGIAWRDGALQDLGRSAIDNKVYHKGAFKTPTLRDVARRGPYMHDGSLATLEDVVEFYDRGGNKNPYLDENMVPLRLSDAEKKALLAFLRNALNGTMREGAAGVGQ
jgi:cytochrome c peroxidase